MKNVRWSWGIALRMSVIALLPFLLIISGLVEAGLIFSIGVIPAAVIPLPPLRKDRSRLVIIGGLFGLSIIIGSFLAQNPVVAVIGIALLAFGASYLTATKQSAFGSLVVALCVPIVGIGLSYPVIMDAVMIGLVLLAGSVWAYLVSLFAPESNEKVKRKLLPVAREEAIRYGAIFAAAGGLATAIPLALGWDHAGWVAGATLLVMRPTWQAETLRVWGRLGSVVVGALLAAIILALGPSEWVVASLMLLAIVIAGATQGSRWYILPTFTTFIVFFVLLYVNTTVGDIFFRFNERILETLLGVTIATVFGVILLLASHRTPSMKPGLKL